MQHLDHEIKDLNESNMKIEADMMHLQTQVSIYSDRLSTPPGRSIWQSFLFYLKADLVYGM